jgi:predicted lipoprotein with Yx(FWY)xxD motif
MNRLSLAIVAAAALAAGGCATSDTAPKQDSSYGAAAAPAAAKPEVLTDGNGMTLYFFDKDVAGSGKSTCNGQCATNWPPQPAGSDSTAFGKYTIVTRDDGTKQWAYNGRPLYRWAKDQKPGDRTGDNVNNVWHVATP